KRPKAGKFSAAERADNVDYLFSSFGMTRRYQKTRRNIRRFDEHLGKCFEHPRFFGFVRACGDYQRPRSFDRESLSKLVRDSVGFFGNVEFYVSGDVNSCRVGSEFGDA